MRRFFELTADGKADLGKHFRTNSDLGEDKTESVTLVAEILRRIEGKDFQVR